MPSIPWSRLNTVLLLLVLIAFIAMFASRAYGGPLDPPAAPGSTDGVRLPGTPISALPFSISQPGSYYVTRNLTVTGSNNGITIDADNVTLDLGGFTLSRSDKLWTGIGLPNAHSGVVVRNGQVTGFGEGVNLDNASDSRIENVIARNNGGVGMRIGPYGHVAACTINHNQSGLVLESNAVVSGCHITYNQGNGVYMVLSALIEDNEIAFNAIGAPGYAGVYVGGSDGVIRGNDLEDNGYNAQDVLLASGAGATIIDNTVDQCAFVGGSTASSFIPVNGVEHSNVRKLGTTYC